MTISLDAAGRVVVPKPIRDAMGLRPGTELEVSVAGGIIQLKPVTHPVRLERHGDLVVAVRDDDHPVLTEADVEETIRRLRGDDEPSAGRSVARSTDR